MSFDSYTNLQTEVAEYLARDDLNSKIPSWITLTEAKLNRELFVRQMEQRSTTTADTTSDEPEFISLPSDFQSMRSVRLSSVTGKPRLDFLSQTQMDDKRYHTSDDTGQPWFFTIIGGEMQLFPTPDRDYTIEMVYRKNIPALASNTSNWLLALAPDVYLYGALLEAAPYTKQDARIQVWGLGYSTALQGLNNLGLMSTFNAGPLAIRNSGQTP